MRVLVTGGAGFIGSHVTDAFADRGDEVTVLDDLSRGRAARLTPDVALHKTSITDAAALTAVVERVRPDVICHLAAQIDVRVSVTAPAEDARANVVGTINLLEAARTSGARVVFASTGGAIYGEGSPIPSAEDVPPTPAAPYGTAKYCAEQYLALYNRLYGTRHAVLRLANVYGVRQDPAGEAGVVAIFAGRALRDEPLTVFGDGTQTRDYVYVGDVAEAFAAAADTYLAGVWNIGTAVETTVLDLIALTSHSAEKTLAPDFAPARPGELQRSAVDPTQAHQDLAWTPATPIAEGVAKVYQWIADGSPDR